MLAGAGQGAAVPPPQHLRILANLGKYGQSLRFFWAKFKIFLVFCIGFFGQFFFFFGVINVSPPPIPAFENFGKFGQIRARFKIFLGNV